MVVQGRPAQPYRGHGGQVPQLGVDIIATVGVLIVTIIISWFGLHRVHEGYVGIYWRGGALLDTYSNPGFHIMLPLITTMAQVQVSVQTDRVRNIPCGTSGGVMVYFDTIEVVNQLQTNQVLDTIKKFGVNYDRILIFDKIHHEINQFCSGRTLRQVYIDEFPDLDELLVEILSEEIQKWAPGLDIIAMRVTKPRVPDTISRNYEELEAQKTQLLVQKEVQKIAKAESETARLVAEINATMESDISAVDMEMQILQTNSQQKIQALQDEALIYEEKVKADAVLYNRKRIGEANKNKFTEEYLRLQRAIELKNVPKTYFVTSLDERT